MMPGIPRIPPKHLPRCQWLMNMTDLLIRDLRICGFAECSADLLGGCKTDAVNY